MANEVAATEQKEMGLMLGNNISMFLDTARSEFAQRVAGMFAKSSMVPTHFQNNMGNCMIALNLAERMRVDPFMLMQNLYIVHGRPGIEAKLAIALINGNGRFEPIEFEFEGKGDTRQCRATAKEIRTGKVLQGPWVSWTMAKAERWVDKDGSKWKTMPDLMFMYRSAMFFARVYDPGVLLGLRTKDELDDMVIDVTPQVSTPQAVDDLTAAIRGKEEAPGPEAPVNPDPNNYPCHICGYKCTSERGLKKHITQSHGKPETVTEPPPADPPQNSIEPEDPPEDPGPVEEAPLFPEPNEDAKFFAEVGNYWDELDPKRVEKILEAFSVKAPADVPKLRRKSFLSTCKAQLDKQLSA